MRYPIVFFFLLMINQCSLAQDTLPVQWNLIASYYAGGQFFSLNRLEYANNESLKEEVPTGSFYNYGQFTPTIFQQIELSANVFKNKSWQVGLNKSWGSNEATSYGYTADISNNTMTEYKSKVWFSARFFGYFLKKNIRLNQWGTFQPSISFFPAAFYRREIEIRYVKKDNITGNILESGYSGGGGGTGGDFFRGILSLLNSPKISLDYSVKLYHHILFTFRYSYWWADSRINDFYGASEKLVIFSRHIKIPSRQSYYFKDLYSHNLSIGLSLSLRK